MAKIIQKIHKKNIGHGDIKNQNVLGSDINFSSPLLIDFGATDEIGVKTQIGSISNLTPDDLSNPNYMKRTFD